MKICSKCGFVGEDILFVKGLNQCSECIRIYKKEYYKKNRVKSDRQKAEYYKKNKIKIKSQRAEYRKREKEKINKYNREYSKCNLKEYNKKYNKEWREKTLNDLDDCYIISLLGKRSNLTAQDIRKYPELIEVKRIQIKINRLIKQKQKL